MRSPCYRIGAKVLVPLVLLLVGLMALLAISLIHDEVRAKIIVLIAILLPVVILLVSSLRRRLSSMKPACASSARLVKSPFAGMK